MCLIQGQNLPLNWFGGKFIEPTLVLMIQVNGFINYHQSIHISECKILQNTKNNKFYTFCPKILPFQSSQSCLNIQSCYSNRVYLHDYCSFLFFFSLSSFISPLSSFVLFLLLSSLKTNNKSKNSSNLI